MGFDLQIALRLATLILLETIELCVLESFTCCHQKITTFSSNAHIFNIVMLFSLFFKRSRSFHTKPDAAHVKNYINHQQRFADEKRRFGRTIKTDRKSCQSSN